VVMAGMGFCIMVALPAYMLVEAYPRNNLALFVAMVLLLGVGQVSTTHPAGSSGCEKGFLVGFFLAMMSTHPLVMWPILLGNVLEWYEFGVFKAVRFVGWRVRRRAPAPRSTSSRASWSRPRFATPRWGWR
jgi:hypothetical protein